MKLVATMPDAVFFPGAGSDAAVSDKSGRWHSIVWSTEVQPSGEVSPFNYFYSAHKFAIAVNKGSVWATVTFD